MNDSLRFQSILLRNYQSCEIKNRFDFGMDEIKKGAELRVLFSLEFDCAKDNVNTNSFCIGFFLINR